MSGQSRIRPWRAADLESLVRHANDREVWLNLRDRFPHPYTWSDGEQFLDSALAQEPVRYFAIEHDGLAVGGVGIEPGEDIERISGELGYWVGREHWGRGLATEAAREATTYAFEVLGLHRVWATPFKRNPASIRVLEKLGFRPEGEFVECVLKEGRLESMLVYAITAPEWTAGPIAGHSPPS
ncbi:MAG TPA: GNAT family protein [Actinomycetota bacterium]|nr:GNAT family protein [Actinomycetota bacterium]